MKGDFTRSTFKSEKHYSSVRMQQGRVQLDADWNEQMDINSYRIEKEASDLIGHCGVPWNEDGGGFKLEPTSDGKNLTISPGSIYVDGILCENPESINITDQEDLPDCAEFHKLGAGTYLAYLDVWQRHITSIEDPQIREVALGGPDTATRTKTVWQVKLEKLDKYVTALEEAGQINCKLVNSGWKTITNNLIEKRDVKLAAFTKQETPGNNPCIISPGAGYRRLENQLYRVEIHRGGKTGEATFKWSRDNGSVVFAIEEFLKDVNGNLTRLKVKQPGKDKMLSLKAGDWIEVLDDAMVLSEEPAGALVQITESPDVSGCIISLSQAISGYDIDRHPRVRRWDQQSDAISVTSPSGSDSIELEDGIHVRFSGNNFKAGDYWLIPARTATENTEETGKIEWPQDESKTPPEPAAMLPEGIVHHYCRLAVIQMEVQEDGNAWTVADCRKLFPAVTELISFFQVCGDGQEAMPGELLPTPLQVAVTNGKWPVKNAPVRFEVKNGGGKLSAKNLVIKNPVINLPALNKTSSLIVKTNSEGVAKCTWKLGGMDPKKLDVPPLQLVEARLLDSCFNPVDIPPLRFNANLSVAGEVAYTLPDCGAVPLTCNVVGSNYQYWASEQYPAIELSGENYIPLLAGKDPIWKSHVNKLARLVLDSDEKYTIRTGEPLDLGEGYTLLAKQIDVDSEKVWLEFSREGEPVGEEIISVVGGSDTTWDLELNDIEDEDNVVVFRVHVNQVFQGAVDSIAQIEGLWLIDYANARTLKAGDEFGEFTVIEIIDGVDESNPGRIIFKHTTNPNGAFPTVKELLEKKVDSWPPANTAGNVSVKGVLDTFMCDFNAAHLPLDSDLCNVLSNAGVKTVQDALNVLCGGIGEGGCCVFVSNTKQLQAALKNLKDGGTICLLAGDFKIGKISIEGLNNIAIRGCTPASRLFVKEIIEITNCNNVVIENLDISGFISVNKVENFTLKKNQLTQTAGVNLKMEACTGALIESNLFILIGKNGLVFENSNDLKIRKNRINVDFSSIEIVKAFSCIFATASSDIEIEGNLIRVSGKNAEKRATFTGIQLGDVEEREVEGYVSVVSNRINSINGPSLKICSTGPVRVHGNVFKSTLRNLGQSSTDEGITLNLESPRDRIIFTDNMCYSSSIGKPVNDNYVYLIGIKGQDTVFSNNNCEFKADSENTVLDTTHVYIHIPPKSGFVANVIGNRCSEYIVNDSIYSIFAGVTSEFVAESTAILIGNTTRNMIRPEPKELNLRG